MLLQEGLVEETLMTGSKGGGGKILFRMASPRKKKKEGGNICPEGGWRRIGALVKKRGKKVGAMSPTRQRGKGVHRTKEGKEEFS